MTEPQFERELSTTLRVAVATSFPDDGPLLTCLNCRKPLDMHQPDSDFPGRMLATCRACQSWHLVDCEGGVEGSGALVVLLPRAAWIRSRLRPPGRPGANPDAAPS